MYKYVIPGILTLLAMLITFFISRMFTFADEAVYWITLGSFFRAEIFLGYTVAELQRSDDKAMPQQLLPSIVSVGYLAFVAIAAVSFADSVSPEPLLMIHVPGLFAALVLYALLSMAYRNTVAVQENIERGRDFRKSMVLELERILCEKRELFDGNCALNSKILSLRDAVSFLADSVSGSEDADEKLRSQMEKLDAADNTDTLSKIADELMLMLEWRQSVVKNLR